MYIGIWLFLGFCAGGYFISYVKRRPDDAKCILARALVIAAAFYVVFAVRSLNVSWWLTVELIGVGAYGGLALLGVKRSAWWLASAWALHPVWDIAIHYLGPGASFAPDWYAIACVSFDLLVAAYVAHIAVRGLPNASRTTCAKPRASET